MLHSANNDDTFGDNEVRINVNSMNPRNLNTNSYNINSNIAGGGGGNNNNNNTGSNRSGTNYSNNFNNNNSRNNTNTNNSMTSNNMPVINARNDFGTNPGLMNLYGGVGGDSVGGFYSNGVGAGGPGSNVDADNKSIVSTPSRISKFTYSEYPQIKPTNPLYQSTNTIKTAASAVSRTSRASTMNTVSRRQKYNPNKPRRIHDWRWVSALAVLLFFPTGLIAIGLAIKARTKFDDGFIDQAKVLNKRAFLFCIISFTFGVAWLLTAFFLMDKWPRTNG